MAVFVLQETGTADDAAQLDAHWRARPTFVFAPRRTASADWLHRAAALLPPTLQQGHFALLTSGSTGEPKLVVGSRARAEQLASVLHRAQDSDPVEETIVALPLSYSYAFVNQWLWSRVANRRLVLTEGFRKPEILYDALHNAHNAMLCLVGSQLALLGDQVFPSIVRLHFAGGRFPQEQLERLRVQFPTARIYNNYGCAEALPRLTVRGAADGEAAADIGLPIEGVELRSDPQGALQFRSAHGAIGIVEHDAFRRIAAEEWVPTGDLGTLREDGHWHLEGRSGDVFKRHGEKVSGAALVTAISKAWRGGALTYRENDPAGEPGIVLLLAPHPESAEVNGILRALRESLPRPHWPLRIEALPELPVLPNGKPDAAAASAAPGRDVLWRQRI